jgi:hypothetical protein
MRWRILRLVPVVAVLVATALSACDGCRNEPGGVAGPRSGATPASPVEVARSLGERVPGDVPAAILVDDWSALASAWVGIRPRLASLLGGVGMMENDLRNTLGFDPARPESLREIGIHPDGGLLLLLWGGTPVIALDLVDSAALVRHATSVLQNQPFRLRAPVRQRTEGRWAIHEFRRSEDGPVQVEVMIRDRTGLLVLQPRSITDRPLAEAFDATTAATSLSAQAGFESMLVLAADFPIVGFMHYGPVAAHAEQTVEGSDGLVHVAEKLRDLGSISFGIQPSGESFHFSAAWQPIGLLAEAVETLFANATAPSAFAPFVADGTFFVARTSVDTSALVALARSWVPPAQRGPIEEAFEGLRTERGIDVEADIVGSLGGNAMLLATRVRPLTLRRVLESRRPAPGEVASAFGLMGAFDVSDRAQLLRAIDTVVPLLEGTISRFEEDGAIVLQFTDGRFDVGTIVLLDGMLLVVPERERSAVIRRVRAGGGDVASIRDEAARALVTDSHVQGAHLDIRAVIDGPVGSALRPMLPEQANRALGTLDLITFDLRREAQHLRARGTLLFTPVVEEATAQP